jgi:hypothetical protein
MSQNPDNPYEDEYFEEIGRQELIAQALKEISEESIRQYLGIYGDAIDSRIYSVLTQARYAQQAGYPHFAVIGAVTAIERITRYMLFRPLLQGAFLSDDWAQLLTRRVTAGRTKQERDILPRILELHKIKIKELKLSDKSFFWKALTEKVIPKRNRITHDGEFASPADAALALECASVPRDKVVFEIANKLGFTIEESKCWHKIADPKRDDYDSAEPFTK